MIESFLDYLSSWSGVKVSLGLLTAYLLGLLSLTLARTFVSAGSAGLIYGSRVFMGWRDYTKNTHNIVNITMYTFDHKGKLVTDTWVEDTPILNVWHNLFQIHKLWSYTKKVTRDNAIIRFSNGDWKKFYDPLVSLAAARTSNEGAIDYAIGKRMNIHRFVLVLTYEPHVDERMRHFRTMAILEQDLINANFLIKQNMLGKTLAVDHRARLYPVVNDDGSIESYRTKLIYQIAEEFVENPSSFGILNVWRPIEGEIND